MNDKTVIESWLQAYNKLFGVDYKVIEHPDGKERTRKAIDALCEDSSGNRLAIEHTLIQPFVDEKGDSARFLRTLASLEDNPDLVVQGYTIHASQPVASVPNKVQWTHIRDAQLHGLKTILPSLSEGFSEVTIPVDDFTIPIGIRKMRTPQGQKDGFKTARVWPGDPGSVLILAALKAKVSKLAKYSKDKKILLLEKDAIAGTIESQFEKLPATAEVQSLLGQIDEIWSVNTACLQTETVLFSNMVWPNFEDHICSLNLKTGEFWRRPD
jgi:hypothetical protein